MTTSSGPAAELAPGEAHADVPGGRVWYEVVGDGPGLPLLLLHGGPGAGSYYFESLRALADERPVVFYDQLGCGRSERPDDASLWTLERFVDELAAVRRALGLDHIHLLGHSWGTTLAMEALLGGAAGIERLVLVSPVFDTQRYLAGCEKLRAALPTATREALERHEAAGTTDSEEYQGATMEFYARHLCRLDPWPEVLGITMERFGWPVYHTLWGPAEHHATGLLKDLDQTPRIAAATLPPSMVIVGEHDEVLPETAAEGAELLNDCRLEVLADASHLSFVERPEALTDLVRAFLQGS